MTSEKSTSARAALSINATPQLTMSAYGVDVIGMFLRRVDVVVVLCLGYIGVDEYFSLYERECDDLRWLKSNGLISTLRSL